MDSDLAAMLDANNPFETFGPAHKLPGPSLAIGHSDSSNNNSSSGYSGGSTSSSGTGSGSGSHNRRNLPPKVPVPAVHDDDEQTLSQGDSASTAAAAGGGGAADSVSRAPVGVRSSSPFAGSIAYVDFDLAMPAVSRSGEVIVRSSPFGLNPFEAFNSSHVVAAVAGSSPFDAFDGVPAARLVNVSSSSPDPHLATGGRAPSPHISSHGRVRGGSSSALSVDLLAANPFEVPTHAQKAAAVGVGVGVDRSVKPLPRAVEHDEDNDLDLT